MTKLIEKITYISEIILIVLIAFIIFNSRRFATDNEIILLLMCVTTIYTIINTWNIRDLTKDEI